MRKEIILGLLAVLAMGLSGCERAKEQMGLTRRSPDEFKVVTRAPLEIPENINALPAPQPGMQRPQEMPAVAQAKEAVIGTPQVTHSETQSSAEQALLQKTGANAAQPDIRAVVDREAEEEVDDKRPVVKKLLDIGSDVPPATIVDPAAEAQRIKTNKETGQPITTGETPTLDE